MHGQNVERIFILIAIFFEKKSCSKGDFFLTGFVISFFRSIQAFKTIRPNFSLSLLVVEI